LVVPKSIPMTEPLTFSSPPSAYPRANMAGALNAGVRRAAEAARGKNYDEVRECWTMLEKCNYLQSVIILRTTL
jgi:hypothetical protein